MILKVNYPIEKLAGLDHLRAIAILLVLVYHLQFFGHPSWYPVSFIQFGHTGVDLFFVLSGYLISLPLFENAHNGAKPPLAEFFIKRFFRIMPAFWVVLALYAIFAVLRECPSMAPLWRYLTFTLNFDLDLRYCNVFTHCWSLCVEEQFYLVLPLLFWMFSFARSIGRKPVYLIAGLFVLGLILRQVCWVRFVVPSIGHDFITVWLRSIYYPTYCRLDGLLVGVSIAGLFSYAPSWKERINRHSYIVLAGGLALLCFANAMGQPFDSELATVSEFPLISLGYGAILAAVVSPKNICSQIKLKATAVLADLSYSIYLSHKLVIHSSQMFLKQFGMADNSDAAFIGTIVCVLLVAAALRITVEKPALEIRRRLLEKMRRSRQLSNKDDVLSS